jgi:hypothetical protein
MTRDEKQQLKALFVATGMYYGHQLHDQALELYVADLEDLPFPEVAQVLGELRRDPKIRRCPLPADVRSRLEPSNDPEAIAVAAAAEIVEAIGRVGPYRSPILSLIAGEVVRLEGGWQRVCEVVTNDNQSIYKAQWRELAKSILARSPGQMLEQIADRRDTVALKALGVNLPSLPPEDGL